MANLLIQKEIDDEMKVLGLVHKDWSTPRLYLTASWNVYKEATHTVLDLIGLIPFAGELADGTNATLYTLEGDYVNASFSAISMVPLIGDAAGKGAKYTRKVVQCFKVGNRFFTSPVRKAAYEILFNSYGVKIADAIWDARNSKLIRKVITDAGKALNVTWQAHHVIPKELIETTPILQNAIKEGFDFNKLGNLIPLDNIRHLGSHGNYTAHVTQLIETIEEKLPTFTDKQKIEKAVEIITETINKTKGKIDDLTFTLK